MPSGKKCIIQQCCCGCSLRLSALCIAVTLLIIDVAFMIYNIWELTVDQNWLVWLAMGLEAANLLVDSVLLAGVLKENHRALMVWVWVSVAQVVAGLVAVVLAFYVASTHVAILVVIVGITFAALYSGAIVVVRSFAIGVKIRAIEESSV